MDKITKRTILSAAHKVFDPIGFTCPVSLCPKLLLRTLYESKINWDQEVNEDIKGKFLQWVSNLSYLIEIKIPRWLPGTDETSNWSLHTFCDASQLSYAAVVYLRVESFSGVRVQLIQAKSRVTPLKKVTIPRLELLAALIAARLHSTVMEHLRDKKIESLFWTDSTTVLAWMQRNEQWGTFVWNRIEEIKKLTYPYQWRHVPGSMNPADLPSRGCTAKKLLNSKWWEGPNWLRNPPAEWPTLTFSYNEIEINEEKRKMITSSMLVVERRIDWYYRYFSKYRKIVNLIGWVLRFVNNCRHSNQRITDDLTLEEVVQAELLLMKFIQNESFVGIKDEKISCLCPFIDDNGILRLKTKITQREDTVDFRYPILLPANHPVVHRLIMEKHEKACHVGVQGLLCILREQFWILGGRKTIRSIIYKCVICRRHQAKKVESLPASLPTDRVKDASTFEITGVDLAGPLFLKGAQKAWVCLFTCAVYRAVHFEMISSLSTDNFLQAFRRFVARRGRPLVMYSDNGTNFRGAENAFKKLNWQKISNYSTAERIKWKFNPPTAPWWGGWWERLIALLKQLLRKVLGKTSLNFEDMITVLCDCEAVINGRPLTYLSESVEDLIPLTPAMFLQDIREVGLPDCDLVESSNLNRSMRYRQKIRDDLRKRFRSEYLSQLLQRANNKNHQKISVGDMVYVGSDTSKRIEWPLARVIELITGRDGEVRLVRLRTTLGEMLRPIQRLYPLEISSSQDNAVDTSPEVLRKRLNSKKIRDTNEAKEVKETRSGRKIKVPIRLGIP